MKVPFDAESDLDIARLTKHVQGQLREVFSCGGNLVFEGPITPRAWCRWASAVTCSDLTYGGVKLFKVPRLDAIRRLLRDDPQAGEVLGFLVFPKLGVAMTGFHSSAKIAPFITPRRRRPRAAGRSPPTCRMSLIHRLKLMRPHLQRIVQ